MIVDRIAIDEICSYVNMRREFIAKPVSATRRPMREHVGKLSEDWVRRWEARFFEIIYVVYVWGTPIAWVEESGTVVKVSCALPPAAQRYQDMISFSL